MKSYELSLASLSLKMFVFWGLRLMVMFKVFNLMNNLPDFSPCFRGDLH